MREALTKLDQVVTIHAAMREGFVKLYGYTSDAAGIRHALLEEGVSVGYDEAKFMLVACSAFVNYLTAEADKAGLLS